MIIYIYSLFEISKTFLLFFLLNDYCIRNYPNKHREILIEIMFKLIFLYSKCQILFNKGLKYFIEKNPKIVLFIKKILDTNINLYNSINNNINNNDKKDINDIKFIKDGKIIAENNIDDFINMISTINLDDYDFVIYIHYNSIPNNIKIINKKTLLYKEYTYCYENSNVKFVLVEFIVDDKIYKIDLSTDKYNFYIVDNMLDKNFFIYYLQYYHPDKIVLTEKDIKDNIFKLKIIDQNIAIKEINYNDDKQCIHFGKFDYMIM